MLGPLRAARGAVLIQELAGSSERAENPLPMVGQVGAAVVHGGTNRKFAGAVEVTLGMIGRRVRLNEGAVSSSAVRRWMLSIRVCWGRWGCRAQLSRR